MGYGRRPPPHVLDPGRACPSTLTNAIVDGVSVELLSHFEHSNLVLLSYFDISASSFPVPRAKGDGRGMRVLQ